VLTHGARVNARVTRACWASSDSTARRTTASPTAPHRIALPTPAPPRWAHHPEASASSVHRRVSACTRKGVTLAIPTRKRRIPCHPGQPRQGGQCVPTACPERGREPRPTRHPLALNLRTLGDHGMAHRGRHGPKESHHAVRAAATPSTSAVRLPAPTAALPAPAAQPATPAVRTTARLDTSVRHPAPRAVPAPAVVRRPRRRSAPRQRPWPRDRRQRPRPRPGFTPVDLGLVHALGLLPGRVVRA
jgi:hypothetical protein